MDPRRGNFRSQLARYLGRLLYFASKNKFYFFLLCVVIYLLNGFFWEQVLTFSARSAASSRPKVLLSTITLGKSYADEFRVKNVERMQTTFTSNFRVFTGFHGKDEKALRELINQARSIDLYVDEYYASKCVFRWPIIKTFYHPTGVEFIDESESSLKRTMCSRTKDIKIGKIGLWTTFISVFQEVYSTYKDNYDCLVVAEDDFVLLESDRSTFEEACNDLLLRDKSSSNSVIVTRLSLQNSCNVYNIKGLKKMLDIYERYKVQLHFDHFCNRWSFFQTSSLVLDSYLRPDSYSHSDLKSMPMITIDSWNRCMRVDHSDDCPLEFV
mmetsp:Transcript_5703/g.6584  ORF Transcript_5703/g.6584 Transcript_5703/m.6584 type:complete len:326 (-) Transcript_5703:135-1112(-)